MQIHKLMRIDMIVLREKENGKIWRMLPVILLISNRLFIRSNRK